MLCRSLSPAGVPAAPSRGWSAATIFAIFACGMHQRLHHRAQTALDRMEIRATNDVRYYFAAALAFPLIIAIALPLYLSGTPKLLAKPVPPTARPVEAVNVATATPTADTGLENRASTAPTDVPDDPQNEELAAVVKNLLAERSGIYGIIIEKPGENVDYRLNADVPFLAASLYKLVLLADIYDGIARGTVSSDLQLVLLPEYFPGPDEPVDSYFAGVSMSSSIPISEALFATGAYSSNVAARALLELTDEISLEASARQLGMNNTYFYVDPRDLPDWPPAGVQSGDSATLDEAVKFAELQADAGELMLTTPRDIATYFDRLLSDRVVNPAVSGLILSILMQQAVDDRFPCLLPAGTEIAHKTGNLDHVVHDVGIIWSPEGPVILVAMVENAEDDAEASFVIQQLALVAYHDFDEPALAADATPNIMCGT